MILVALLVSPFARAAEPAIPLKANPALWVVEKGGKKLHLFGSIHLLPAQTQWRRAEIEEAVAAAEVFVFEAPLDAEGSQAMTSFVADHGKLRDGKTLQDVLPPDLYAAVEKASWQVHYPPMMLKQFRPWLAAVSLELFGYIKAGFSTFYGVDNLIEADAKKAGRKLVYLESVEEQLQFFARLDHASEIAYLRETTRSILEEPNAPYDLVNAWASGKPDKVIRLLNDAFARVPALRKQLLVARNKNWIPKIEAMLAGPDLHFVTVGIGHLVGPDSVVALLRAKGYKITGP
jgi:uncharacterized protein YbaP (TraB family)